MLLSNLLSLVTRTIPTKYTQAYSLAPTGNWDGNDGGWSTFAVRVGTPPQSFRVLPSTSGTDIWVPLPDSCSQNSARCGSARGVDPFNAAPPGSSSQSGTPSNINGSSVDPGATCTINRSPQCIDCVSIGGKCSNGPCAGRQCCGDPKGACNSTCNGLNGICTGLYIGCPCTGPDYNAAGGAVVASATSPFLAQGFSSNSSSSWGGSKISPVGEDLGVVANGLYGTDSIGIGVDPTTGLTLTSGKVVGVNASSFYIGTLGLAAGDANSSMLSQLFTQKMIPSLSYGYTAGAIYQTPPVLGSLTLGGYDAARTNRAGSGPNMTSILKPSDNSIMVSIGAISVSNALTKDNTLLSIENNLTTIIDTTLPYTYLPPYVCQSFESAFGLQWDANHQMYLVNATIHQQLLKLDPSVMFTLSTSLPKPAALNITLPYSAFDLSAAYPIFPNGTNYFPLRRANSSSQYILGRQFMQEAYLFVDYETSKFTISQAAFPTNGQQSIITVDHSINGSTGLNGESSTSGGLSVGAIAGTAIGVSAAVVLLCTLAFLIWRSRHSKRRPEEVWRAPVSHHGPSGGPSADTSNVTGTTMSELDKDYSTYSPPSAFRRYQNEQTKSMAYWEQERQSQMSPGTKRTSSGITKPSPRPNHQSREVDPWAKSELEAPVSPPTAKTFAGSPTGPTPMFSIMDDIYEKNEKPLPPPPSVAHELQGSGAAHEMFSPKPWEQPASWSSKSIPSQEKSWPAKHIAQEQKQRQSPRPELKERQNPRPDMKERQGSRPSLRERQDSRPTLGGQRKDSYSSIRVDNTVIVDTESSDQHGAKPSVGSEASKARQKHIWEMHAGSPGGSRGNSRVNSRKHSRKNTSETASPTPTKEPAGPGVGTAL